MSQPHANSGVHLTDEEEADVRQQIIASVFGGATPSDQPQAYFFAGQPGAGKSTAIGVFQERLSGAVDAPNWSVVQGDEFRAFHPDYDALLSGDDRVMAAQTSPDMHRWYAFALDHALRHRYSFLAELSMRDPHRTRNLLMQVKQAGFAVSVVALAVRPEVSRARALDRYYETKRGEGGARYVQPSTHDEGVANLKLSINAVLSDGLCDQLHLVNSQIQLKWSSESDDGDWVDAYERCVSEPDPDPDLQETISQRIHDLEAHGCADESADLQELINIRRRLFGGA